MEDQGLDTGRATEWLTLALDSAHVAMGVSRLSDGVLVDANEAFCRLFGLTREQAIGRRSADLHVWVDPAQRERMIETIRQRGAVTGYEAMYRNRQGEIGDLVISARIVQRDGAPHLIGFLTDVTDRREMIDGLQAAQGRLGVVLRASGILVFRQDRELRYTWVANPALGATESDLLGRSDDEIMGADAAAPLVAIKRRVLDTGRAERHDVWVTNSNGQRGCFDLTVEPERDATGRVVAIVCAAQDITARMDAQARTDLTQAGRALRPPLRTIHGLTALIGREPLSRQQAGRLDRIAAQTRRLEGVLDTIPELTPPSAGATARDALRERHGGATVLVAEGNAVLRELVALLLEDAGLRVVTAASGVEALDTALRRSPALVLLDVELPQRGGVAAALAIRAMAPQRMPIVAMASEQPVADPATLIDADLDDILVRPVRHGLLHETVLAWLDAG